MSGWKIDGKELNLRSEIVDYVWPNKMGDPYDVTERLHKLADVVRDEDADFEAQADDLDDAAEELEQLFDRIFETLNKEI